MLDSLGAALSAALHEEATNGYRPVARRIPTPPPGTANLSDPLVATITPSSNGSRGQRTLAGTTLGGNLSSRDDNAKMRKLGVGGGAGGEQSLFAACAAGEEEVIRIVLSVYVRRGRLPEPGEVLFCTAHTTDEDLELAVRRFAGRRDRVWRKGTSTRVLDGEVAAERGLGTQDEGIFVIADVDRLSYSTQAVLLGHLRSKVLERDGDVSGSGGDGPTPYVYLLIAELEQCFL